MSLVHLRHAQNDVHLNVRLFTKVMFYAVSLAAFQIFRKNGQGGKCLNPKLIVYLKCMKSYSIIQSTLLSVKTLLSFSSKLCRSTKSDKQLYL